MRKTSIWAHRGASGYAPENTLAAFEIAIKMKADGIELDVQMTKDGELVVIHDETLDRVCLFSGWVKDYTLKELKALNVNNNFLYQARMKIPTLKEVFELVKDTDLMINIELKNGIIFYKDIEEKVINLVKEHKLLSRIVFSSFNHISIMKIKHLEPSAQVGFIYGDGFLNVHEYGKKYGVDALHPAFYNLQYSGIIEKCRDFGLKVNTWTVNEIEHLKMACEMKVDAIITNYPDRARKVLESYE